MASTKDMMFFLALIPGRRVCFCDSAQASGLKAGGQYGDGARIFLLPLREKVARTKSVPDEGLRPIDRPCPLIRPEFRYAHSSHLLPRGEKEKKELNRHRGHAAIDHDGLSGPEARG